MLVGLSESSSQQDDRQVFVKQEGCVYLLHWRMAPTAALCGVRPVRMETPNSPPISFLMIKTNSNATPTHPIRAQLRPCLHPPDLPYRYIWSGSQFDTWHATPGATCHHRPPSMNPIQLGIHTDAFPPVKPVCGAAQAIDLPSDSRSVLEPNHGSIFERHQHPSGIALRPRPVRRPPRNFSRRLPRGCWEGGAVAAPGV